MMTSRKRLLAAMRREEVDHLPCSIYFNPSLRVSGYNLTDWKDRVRLQLDLVGDPVVHVGIPSPPHPDVSTRVWLEEV